MQQHRKPMRLGRLHDIRLARVACEAGWGFIHKEDHDEMIMQDAAASGDNSRCGTLRFVSLFQVIRTCRRRR